jgi:hypothetical protein
MRETDQSSRSIMDRLDASQYGDRREEDEDYGEALGIAPPCSDCGHREAVTEVGGEPFCNECSN